MFKGNLTKKRVWNLDLLSAKQFVVVIFCGCSNVKADVEGRDIF